MHGTAPLPHREIEVKLELAPKDLSSFQKISLIRQIKDKPRRATEVSVYFDTDNHKLRKKGLLLRVRRVGERYVQTIKLAASSVPFDRDEWEVEIAGEQPDLSLAKGTALEPVLTKKVRRRLKPLFETRVKRTEYAIADDTRAVALTVDHGTIDAGKHTAPLCEIEIELKRGGAAELFAIARELTQSLPAQLAVKSKSERGYELLDDSSGLPVKSDPIVLPAGLSTGDAFKIVGRACLKQIVSNEPALKKGDPEGVHQMRVGLRRLRAGMAIFGILLRDPQTTTIKRELKWLAGALGPARELDVLLDRVVRPMKKRHTRWEGFPAVSREFASRREAALSTAQAAIRSARFRALTLEVAAWLETGQRTRPKDDLVRDLGNVPIETFAADQLTRRWRKVSKKGKALAKLDVRSRHKLRINTKKLRYSVDFFASLFQRKRAAKRRKKFLNALEELQDGLGELNDIAVHEKRMAAMAAPRRHPKPSEAFAAGLLGGREDARIEAALASAKGARADLAKIRTFWR
jgi:inorganic triphosphatase YgiF